MTFFASLASIIPNIVTILEKISLIGIDINVTSPTVTVIVNEIVNVLS